MFQKLRQTSILLVINGLLSFSVSATTEIEQPIERLMQMKNAFQQQNYSLTFTYGEENDNYALSYRHAYDQQTNYSQLLYLDGPRTEIWQKGNTISYFSANYAPFSIRSENMIDSLPSVVYSDFKQLAQYYDFIPFGKDRIANRIANIIKLMPKDEFRYAYTIWIDEESHLPLKGEVVDRSGTTLSQFKVITLDELSEPQTLIDTAKQLKQPPAITIYSPNTTDYNWQPSWLPKGFKLIKFHSDGLSPSIQTQLYSDGLFSFSLYLLEKNDMPINEAWRQGIDTLYAEVVNNKTVVLVGQIPLTTARRIVQDVKFKESAK
ncbi:negative regulator of sigmaE [Gallibacterium salpingitidis]|uniref:Negative regulator of sigmaE n=1 Tax=Gallibacterium salpingitidis TaxID=505341 RepID=A0AB36E388_9PAST|nr:MucB/RseB C-terminal domain-containing protein [Gallibacterium salpingitidis]OBX09132.1 negative regulator of sigmaE [Gallibacterium salpingitidis]OBX10945.1 negative regulator of sigmaE [Gallibacterium salpingitidis]WKS99677.1 MucB/RseB C-terminal domain-containing protein [Gallibacterium salpingitidis]